MHVADHKSLGVAALHPAVWDKIKPTYWWSFSALPMGLMLGAFVPLWFLSLRAAAALGINPHTSIRDQHNGLLWCGIFLVLMGILMVGGYLLGLIVNALILRFWAGWSVDQVRALFLFSQPPGHWLKNEADAPTAVAMFGKASVAASWATTRKMGQAHFVFIKGTFGWGAWMFLLLGIGPLKFGWPYKMNPTEHTMIGQALLWSIVGTVWGFCTWHLSERTYRDSSSAPK